MTVELTAPDAVAGWLERRRRYSRLTVRPVPFARCRQWHFDDGVLRHETGRFFSVVGFEYEDPQDQRRIIAPMIDQPEVGLLGFLVHETAGAYTWLLQAKTEPGNVGGTQVGPTVQATRSNYRQVHQGKPTPMLSQFLDPAEATAVVSDVEQSEQGDRFLGKFNRNMTVLAKAKDLAPDDDGWAWAPAATMRRLLVQDYGLNTDARSVLFCSDWRYLAGDPEAGAFGRWRGGGGFGSALCRSYRHPVADDPIARATALLAVAAEERPQSFERRSLDALAGWRLDRSRIHHVDGRDPVVEIYAIEARDREVEAWCQPLLANRTQNQVDLLCAVRGGMLQFLLRTSFEPGFAGTPQFGPTRQTGPEHATAPELLAELGRQPQQTRAQVRQSDEGGRFFHSTADYRIIETVAGFRAPERLYHWVTLAELEQLGRHRGLLTNELRSVASMLLAWA